ncbi:MAG TPA: hypothetical protein VLG12_03835 [Candidatus Saccharimonadales bacterium]|nr:hypothetical protein [Candidatus Saccharimonadales bacterium]
MNPEIFNSRQEEFCSSTKIVLQDEKTLRNLLNERLALVGISDPLRVSFITLCEQLAGQRICGNSLAHSLMAACMYACKSHEDDVTGEILVSELEGVACLLTISNAVVHAEAHLPFRLAQRIVSEMLRRPQPEIQIVLFAPSPRHRRTFFEWLEDFIDWWFE